jgi:hypothetical protein
LQPREGEKKQKGEEEARHGLIPWRRTKVRQSGIGKIDSERGCLNRVEWRLECVR